MHIEFSGWERFILIFLIQVVVAYFGVEVARRIRIIRAGRPDRNRLDRIGARVMRWLREVILQQRVIRNRPVAGLLHATVFLGFMLFLVETTDHFLEPFGASFLPALLGPYLQVYLWVMQLIAVLVALAILGLAFRRFVLVKYSPDPKSIESGAVALLIFLLMVSFIDLHGTQVVAAKADWWTHSLCILIFPALILSSKHFHLIMGPVNVFLRNFRLWEVPPLDLDIEDMDDDAEPYLGLESAKDMHWKLRSDLLGCVQCRRCTDACPAATCDQDLRPAEFIIAGQKALLSESLDGAVIGSVISESALGQCTSCMACESVCPVGIEHSQLLAGAKQAQALALGTGSVATDFFKMIEQSGNPFAAPRDERWERVEKLGIPEFVPGETEWLLWMGCVWSYNPDFQDVVASTVKVLKKAGVSFGVLRKEQCSGHHSRKQGEEMQYQTLARENMAAMMEAGVKKFVAGCPHCLHTIGSEYPDLDAGFQVEGWHHSQLITRLIAEGRLQAKPTSGNGQRVTYHDPCFLGRYEGEFDAPREAVKQLGMRVTELPRHGRRSFCCGGGAAGFVMEPKVARRVDAERKDEIKDSGADLLVTACPECKMMLSGAVEETKDVAEVVAGVLG